MSEDDYRVILSLSKDPELRSPQKSSPPPRQRGGGCRFSDRWGSNRVILVSPRFDAACFTSSSRRRVFYLLISTPRRLLGGAAEETPSNAPKHIERGFPRFARNEGWPTPPRRGFALPYFPNIFVHRLTMPRTFSIMLQEATGGILWKKKTTTLPKKFSNS